MPVMMVRHKVADFKQWKAVFDGMDDARRGYGWTAHEVYQNAADPNLIVEAFGAMSTRTPMLRMAVNRETQRARDLRWLVEDFIVHFPYVGTLATRLGAVRACQENAERLLDRGELVAVFPEGIKGVGKLFKERYRLQRFGRGGFVKLAIRTRTPIVPVAIVGAEEMNPLLFRIEGASKVLGIPFFPITPGFPLLGPAGLLPAPTKWKISFGEAIDFGSYGNDVLEDDVAIGRLSERVRSTIQSMLDRAVAERQSVFFG